MTRGEGHASACWNQQGARTRPFNSLPSLSWEAVAIIFVITVLGAIYRSSCLNPGSLWLDDAWQAVLANASLSDQIKFSSSAPIGYTFVLGLFAGLIPDPELGFQLPAYILGVLQVPLFALLAYRVTRSEVFAVWGAALTAVCFHFILYSARVKQYTLDAFLVTLALLCFHKLWQAGDNSRGMIRAAIASALVLSFSFSASIVVAIFLNLLLLRELIRANWRYSQTWRSAVPVIGYNLTALAYYLVFLRHQRNPALSQFWQDYFVPWDGGLGQVIPFLGNRLALTVTSFWHDQIVLGYKGTAVLPEELALVLVTAFLVVIGLSRMRQLQGLDNYWSWSIALMYLSLVALAAVHVFPLGGRRTDSFTIPVTLLALLVGMQSLCGMKPRPIAKYAGMSGALLYALVFGMPSLLGGQPIYPPESSAAEMIRIAEEDFGGDDVMIVYPHGSFAFGHYSSMETKLEASENYSTSFQVEAVEDRVYVLPGIVGYRQEPELLGPALDRVLRKSTGRIILVGSHAKPRVLTFLHGRIEASGRKPSFWRYESESFVFRYLPAEGLKKE